MTFNRRSALLTFSAIACSLTIAPARAQEESTKAQNASLAAKFIGHWKNTNDYKGAAEMDIISVDPSTGQLRGKYVPPAGPAKGAEFDVVGFVSSAPPVNNTDNVITVSFTVSLKAYGSLATWTGFMKEPNKITAMWLNVRPNSNYEWDHIVTGQDVWMKTK